MPATGFRFASARTANRLVAGVPAAARLARAFAQALPGEPLVITLADGGELRAYTRAEIARVAPGLHVRIEVTLHGAAIAGETLPDTAMIAAIWARTARAPAPPIDPEGALSESGRTLIRATAKPGDGMVSRHINRPLSQAVSGVLLRFAAIRPGHATALTALIAAAMLACLLTGTPHGLVAGAVLFQIASVADGIDGEIARATWRSSRRGASLDSVTDGLTNVGFLLGAGTNYLLRGLAQDAGVAIAAAAIMGIGLTLLGRHALRHDGHIHFDGLKATNLATGSARSHLLKDITSRDFYCLFLLVMTIAGLLPLALKLFVGAITIWLIVTLRVVLLWPTPRPQRSR